MEQSGRLTPLPARQRKAPLWFQGWGGAVVAAALCLGSAIPTPAEPPATAPNPEAAERAATIRRAFRDLTDPKPSTRVEARSWLLTLTRQDLPTLREVVTRSRPVQRSQIAALRDVVNHVYLRGEPYPQEPGRFGFMGVMFGAEFETTEPESGGVEIRRRICGFCAYRYLEDGDIIRAVVGTPTIAVHTPQDVMNVIKTFRAGDTVVLETLRDGRVLRIPVVLDAMPSVGVIGNEAARAEFLSRRQNDADKYWDENFESLVNENVS